ncbi:MAG TPA: hypothetical protein VMT22_02220 [Terriglobales bacterium]|jgi:hypothetical protein|nr:hypothetical protein [Terriglobales bacterium]
MNIERNEPIHFHVKGTLDAVTRWIATHSDGIAEWLKNVRRQYQTDRANVSAKHRAAVILLKDAIDSAPARIGVLDVGGAALEDVPAWIRGMILPRRIGGRSWTKSRRKVMEAKPTWILCSLVKRVFWA